MAEGLLESLAVYKGEKERRLEMGWSHHHLDDGCQDKAAPAIPPNPYMMGMTLIQYQVFALEKIPSQELEQSLLLLPFNEMENLFEWVTEMLERGLSPLLASRCAVFLLRLHNKPIAANKSMRSLILRLRDCMTPQLTKVQDTLGFNLAGLK